MDNNTAFLLFEDMLFDDVSNYKAHYCFITSPLGKGEDHYINVYVNCKTSQFQICLTCGEKRIYLKIQEKRYGKMGLC